MVSVEASERLLAVALAVVCVGMKLMDINTNWVAELDPSVHTRTTPTPTTSTRMHDLWTSATVAARLPWG